MNGASSNSASRAGQGPVPPLKLVADLTMRALVAEKDAEIAKRDLGTATAWREDTIELLKRALAMLEELEQGSASLMLSPKERHAAGELANDINTALAQGHL